MNDERDKLLDHDYDGIKELDNDLPRWWVYLFWTTIIWGILYMIYYHVFDIGYLSADEYKSEIDPSYAPMADTDAKLLGVIKDYHSPNYNPQTDPTPRRALMEQEPVAYVEISAESDTITYAAFIDDASLSAGKDIYIKNCLQCHGKLGEGGIGPNLTDKYWLHKGDFNSIVKSVKYGYPSKGMISWRAFLSEEKILQAASYIMTLQGTNPPGAKPPQGDHYEK